jgi:hypothetical protein
VKLLHEDVLSITPKKELNGCGPKGYGWLVPDNYGRVDFTRAGNIHDACYYWLERLGKFQGKPLREVDELLWKKLLTEGRSYADEVFRLNMRELNRRGTTSTTLGYLRVPVIELYYHSVKRFGGFFSN